MMRQAPPSASLSYFCFSVPKFMSSERISLNKRAWTDVEHGRHILVVIQVALTLALMINSLLYFASKHLLSLKECQAREMGAVRYLPWQSRILRDRTPSFRNPLLPRPGRGVGLLVLLVLCRLYRREGECVLEVHHGVKEKG